MLQQQVAAADLPTEAEGFKIHPHGDSTMTGSPPKAEDVVTIDNAASSRAKHRWALRNTRELMPTQRISRGNGPVVELPRTGMPVDTFNSLELKDLSDRTTTIGEFLEKQHTDALLVMVDGRIVNEQYFGGMAPEQLHDVYSTGKSLCSTMIGTMLGRELRDDAAIETYLPELDEFAIQGATIRQLLDMRSGLDYSYGPEPDSELSRHMAMTLNAPADTEPLSQWQFLLEAKRSRPHGEVMNYCEYDVMSVILAAERVTGTRFADLFSQRIWSQLGVEHDAYVRRDGFGIAAPSFGMATTLRDIGRWCQMCVDGGEFNGKRIVPAAYLEDLRAGATQWIPQRAWIAGFDYEMPERTGYRGWFWFPGLIRNALATSGGLGQFCYINWQDRTVIVCFSSWMLDDDWVSLDHSYWHAFEQITAMLR
jgi:CubicO group peptidase (beta-lactamase class C family)